MGTVSYHNQPGIHKTRGAVAEGGNGHIYTVKKVLWTNSVERFLRSMLVGSTLHLCCGHSKIGDVRVDIDPYCNPDVVADASKMCLDDKCFDTVLIDVPYNGRFRWMHDVLAELPRLARKRIIHQAWWMINDYRSARYKKDFSFVLVGNYLWPPRSYFGRVQLIQVFDFDSEYRDLERESNMLDLWNKGRGRQAEDSIHDTPVEKYIMENS